MLVLLLIGLLIISIIFNIILVHEVMQLYSRLNVKQDKINELTEQNTRLIITRKSEPLRGIVGKIK